MLKNDMDPGALAALLAAEYPLIDPPLIIAILSDYPAPELPSQLSAIRDQLGILEATLVPDTQAENENESIWTASESLNESNSISTGVGGVADMEELSNRLESITTAPTASSIASSKSGKKGKAKGKGRGKKNTFSQPSGSGSGSGSAPSRASENISLTDPEDESGYTDELQLLKSLFPAVEETTIKEAFSAEPSLQAAIDHLLSLELIRDVQEHGYWPGEEIPSDNERTALLEVPRTKQRSPKRGGNTSDLNDDVSSQIQSPSRSRASSRSSRSRKKVKQTIPLVDTLQRRGTPSTLPSSRSSSQTRATPIIPSSSTSSSSTNTSTALKTAASALNSGPSPNAWHTVASLASHLSDLVPPIPASYFLSYLHAPEHHSAYTAIRASLDGLPAQEDTSLGVHVEELFDEESRGVLEDMYALDLDLNHAGNRQNGETQTRIGRDLEICVQAVGADLATVIDLMNLLEEISHWPGDDDFYLLPLPSTSSTISLNIKSTAPITSSRSMPASPLVTSAQLLPAVPVAAPIPDVRPKRTPLPGPVVRPVTKGKLNDVTPRNVVGSKPAATAATNPIATDAFGMQSPVPSSPRLGRKGGAQIHPQNWRTIQHPPRPSSTAPKDSNLATTMHKSASSTGFSYNVTSSLSVDDCLARAQLERAKRESAIRAAGRNFRSGAGVAGNKALKGAVAGHYAAQAREAMNRAKEWEMKAARMVVENQLDKSTRPIRNGHSNSNTNGHGHEQGQGYGASIDLHHLTISEATTLAIESSNKWWIKEKERRVTSTMNGERENGLIIVTGIGRHSAGQKGVLGPAVANSLERDGWRVEKDNVGNRGYIVVRGRK